MKSRRFVLIAAVLGISTTATLGQDFRNHYVGPSQGNWSNPTHWSSGSSPIAIGGLPFDGSQSAVVSVTRPTTLTFDADHGPTNSLVTLDLSATSGAPLTFLHPQGALTTRATTLDSSAGGSVAYLNTGGTHTATQPAGAITLAASSGSNAAYRLDNAGRVIAGNLVVGKSGTGSFEQFAGRVDVATNLTIAAQPGSTGYYSLGTGTLVAPGQLIGTGGTGTLRQTGGENYADDGITVGPSGTYQLAGGAAHIRFGTLSVESGGTFRQFAGTLNAASVLSDGTYAQSGGTATIGSLTTRTPLSLSGTASLATQFAHVNTLSIVDQATLDIGTGTLIIDRINTATLRDYLVSSRITSAVLPVDPDGVRTIGYTPFGSPDALLLRATLFGDTDLDGVIDAHDYAALDAGFAAGTGTWSTGDFNHDGLITDLDYLLIDSSLVWQQGSLPTEIIAVRTRQFGAAYVEQLVTAIPEPTAATLLLLAATPLLSRRRR